MCIFWYMEILCIGQPTEVDYAMPSNNTTFDTAEVKRQVSKCNQKEKGISSGSNGVYSTAMKTFSSC